MSTVLPPEFETYVNEAVAAGRYRSAEDVVQEALQLLKDRDCKIDAVLIDGLSGRFVDATPMRLDVDQKTERCLITIKQPVSQIE